MKFRDILKSAKYWLLHGTSAKLRPYEKACLETWRVILPTEGRLLLDQQLKKLTFLQRQVNGKLLCFYDKSDKTWPDALLFPCRLAKRSAARITLKGGHNRKEILVKCNIMLCEGRFFGLEFNKFPEILKDGFNVIESNELLNPMLPCFNDGKKNKTESHLTAAIDSKLPADYPFLLSNAKNNLFNGWHIYNFDQIRKVVQLDQNFWVIAEKDGRGAIGVLEDDQSGQLYYLNQEDDELIKIMTSFEAFLKQDKE